MFLDSQVAYVPSTGPEFWASSYDDLTDICSIAKQCEADGWDGLTVGDTQNLVADPYVMLSAAAGVTDRLRLATAVTNPVTREISVTAAAIASLHVYSGGRAVLGIGRGDSAVASVAKAPASSADFERSLQELQLLLHGCVDNAGATQYDSTTLTLGWLHGRAEGLPVNAYATGERSIEIAARWADQVTFAVGADIESLRSAVGIARRVAGDRRAPVLGAMVNIAPHPDIETSRALVAGYAAVHARFSAMSKRSLASLDVEQKRDIMAVDAAYKLTQHGAAISEQTNVMTASFIDRFCVTGDVDACIRRLRELRTLGLHHFILVTPGPAADPRARALSYTLLSNEVLPTLRSV